jgi:hypothetical protein
VFAHVTCQEQVLEKLRKLTHDPQKDVRAYANYSLGKIYVFKASRVENEEDYRKELEKAIGYFERSKKVSQMVNPSKFCLPFYRSFHTIIFKKQESIDEVNKYLIDAKVGIENSKSKELLFEAVENLANALKEVQKLNGMDLEAKKSELNFYRKYCEQAAELMRETEDTAPYATAAVRKGLPILDRNLKRILEEIRDNAKIACRNSIGTDTEEIACAINQEVKNWEIGSQEEMTQMIEDLIDVFRLKMPHLPGYEYIFREIEGLRDEKNLVKQYKIVCRLIGLVPIFSSMPDRVVQDIRSIKEVMTPVSDELKELRSSVDKLTASIDELQNPQEYLYIIQRDLKEIKDYMPDMKEQIDGVLSQLNSPSSTVTQKLELALPIIPSIVSYKVEADVPKLVDDIKNRFKNLILKSKDK